MNGIHAAFTGRIGKDAEVRSTRDGKPWVAFPVAVDTTKDSEIATSWVKVVLFGETVDATAPKLIKGNNILDKSCFRRNNSNQRAGGIL